MELNNNRRFVFEKNCKLMLCQYSKCFVQDMEMNGLKRESDNLTVNQFDPLLFPQRDIEMHAGSLLQSK